jgi:hypothetical protein
MAGCIVQMGRNWPAYFGLAQPFGLVAHLSKTGEGGQPRRRWDGRSSPEGNDGGDGVRGWWSTACSAGSLCTTAWCLGRGRIGWREAGAGCPRWLNGGGNGSAVSYPVPRKRERSLHTCAQDVQMTRIVTI